MTKLRWHRVKEIFGNALDIPAVRREQWLSERCADAPGILAEVHALLNHRERMTKFLERPAFRADAVEDARPTEPEPPGPVALEPGEELVGRYVVGERIGVGAFGAVHRAEDKLTGAQVALKVIGATGGVQAVSMRREVAILRRARLPGIVRLLDDWATASATYIVMELVEGQAFPGDVGADWARLAPCAITLLEALGRLHWAGVLHRDLKPDNVLVDADGRPTIVDLGVASEVDRSAPPVPGGYVVGTPHFMAPERLRGQPATVATDIYAVGAMLWGALAGEPLHAGDSLPELIAQRCNDPPRPLRSVAPSVPEHIAEQIDRMVALNPQDRPASALLVAARMGGQRAFGEAGLLPRIGPPDTVDAIVEAGREGRSIDVWGEAGMGKTRALSDAAARLAAEGFRVAHTISSSEPYASLAPVIGAIPGDPGFTLADARSWVGRRLASALGSGQIVVADGFEELDEWSAAALQESGGLGCVVRARRGSEGDGVVLAPLAEDDLRRLFAGPDRLHHLREDSAELLFARTAGVPAAFAREMRRWKRDGVVRWEGDRAVVNRPSLDHLRGQPQVALPPADVSADDLPELVVDLAGFIETTGQRLDAGALARAAGLARWRVEVALEALEEARLIRRDAQARVEPLARLDATARWTSERRREAHAAIAQELPTGSEARLFHLIAGDQLGAAPREACDVARQLHKKGDVGGAFAALEEALTLLRRAPVQDADTEDAALILLHECALAIGTAPVLELTLYHLARVRTPSRRTRSLEQICRAALLTVRGDGRRAIALLADAPDDGTPALARSRHIVRTLAGQFSVPEAQREVVAAAAAWVRRHPSRSNRARLSAWVGWLRYRQGRFLVAARLHRRSARLNRDPRMRLSAVLNAAHAALDAGALDEARELAVQSRELAAASRHALHEARAEWITRTVAYRNDDADGADLELLDAADRLGVPNLEGMIYLNEAAVAWRSGRGALAHGLADEAASRFASAGRRWGGMLARSLAAACEAAVSEEEARGLMSDATECPVPGLAVQALGLLAAASSDISPDLVSLGRAKGIAVDEAERGRRARGAVCERGAGSDRGAGVERGGNEGGMP